LPNSCLKTFALEVVYDDEYLAVINKPAGMVVHPGAGISSGTLANAIAYRFKIQIQDWRLKAIQILTPKSQIASASFTDSTKTLPA
jgi:23S rRNA-/tRNA-specific pseudouridylate synthase